MKQVMVLTNRSDTPERFDNASVDIEQFGGINYLMVRQAKAGETGPGALLAAFTIFDFFKVIDTEDHLLEAQLEVSDLKDQVEHLQNLVDLLKLEASAKVVKPALEHLMPPQAPHQPIGGNGSLPAANQNPLPVARPPLNPPAPWPTHNEPTDSGETVRVADMPDEAYASCSMPPQPPKDDDTCHDSSTKKQHLRAKR